MLRDARTGMRPPSMHLLECLHITGFSTSERATGFHPSDNQQCLDGRKSVAQS